MVPTKEVPLLSNKSVMIPRKPNILNFRVIGVISDRYVQGPETSRGVRKLARTSRYQKKKKKVLCVDYGTEIE